MAVAGRLVLALPSLPLTLLMLSHAILGYVVQVAGWNQMGGDWAGL